MPLYEYICDQCKNQFEIKMSFEEKDAGLNPLCPHCQSQETYQQISAGLFIRGSGTSGGFTPTMGCNPGAGSGCCG